uniref:AC5 protein n=1 Tax=Soybean blistering mosaic virus TaxID=408136 RepID=A0A6B9KDU7_9GEMI|nr:AC5 protein [Soybean blistering mosaic virus]
MVLIFPSFLMVVHHVVVDLPETLHKRLLIASILSTRHLCIKLMHNLVTVAEIVLHGSSARLVVKHIKHLAKIHRCPIRSTIPHKPEHDAVSVVLQLDVLVHPYLPQNVHGLNTKTLTNAVSNTVTTCHVRYTHHLPNVGDIMTLLVRLDLTRPFTPSRNIWASPDAIDPGLPVHGPVNPSITLGHASSRRIIGGTTNL